MNHLLLKPHKQPKIKLKIGKEPKVCEIISEIDSGFLKSDKLEILTGKGQKKKYFDGEKTCRSLKELNENCTRQPRFKVKM